MAEKQIYYSDKYYDEKYEYRFVLLIFCVFTFTTPNLHIRVLYTALA